MNTRSGPGAAGALIAVLVFMPIARGQIISEGPDLDAAKSLVVMIDGSLNGEPTQGAGIVFAVEDGWTYIATAYHLVRKGDARATNLRVRFWQKPRETPEAEHYDAKLEYDLAVLRVKGPQAAFSFKRLADPDQLKKSQPVYAIGHPNGEGPWNVTYLPGAITDVGTLRVKVQSPTIKRGHSGGALIDEHKMLVGMVLDIDGTTADILRIDRAAEILRRELELTVELSINTAGPVSTPSPVTIPAPLPSPAAGDTKRNSADGLTYVWIPPGRFDMGCSRDAAGKYDADCYDDEKPSHPENIPTGFWIGQTEVTVGAYQRWPEAKNHPLPTSDSFGRKLNAAAGDLNLPAVAVTWQEAQDYCKWAGGLAGGLRLPKEREWEYAARAGNTEPRYGNLDAVAWYGDNSGATKINSTQWWNENNATYGDRLFKNGNGPHLVQQTSKNAWNLFDTLGNVWEWVEDWYAAYPGGTIRNGDGPQKYRVLRGGSWGSNPRYVRVSDRDWDGPGDRGNSIGFRCAGELR